MKRKRNEKREIKQKIKNEMMIEMKTWNKVTRTKIKEENGEGMNKKLI